MVGEEDEDTDEDDERRKRPRGGDDLDDDFMEEDEDEGWAGIGTGLTVAGAPQPPEDEGDGQYTDLEDGDQSMESGSESEDEEEEDGSDSSDKSDDEHTEGSPESTTKPRGRSKTLARNPKELPFTFSCPSSHEEFLEILEGVDRADVGTVIERIRKLHHPSLGEKNKSKLQVCLAIGQSRRSQLTPRAGFHPCSLRSHTFRLG